MNAGCRERFDRWLTGDLDPDVWRTHVEACAGCAREAAGYRALFAVLAADAEVQPSPALDAAVRRSMPPAHAPAPAAIDAVAGRDPGVLRPGFAIGLAAAAWLALAAALGLATAAAGWEAQGFGLALATLAFYGTTTVVAAVPLFWRRRRAAGLTVNA